VNLKQTLYKKMLRIRMIEESIAHRYKEQNMRCPVHLSIGQEAAAVGVCHSLMNSDWVFSGHRNHAHYLATGGCLNKMIAELHGKDNGCTAGIGGSMHLTDIDNGFIGATPIVGSTVPIAVGAALSNSMRKQSGVVVIFFGDGAMETGVLHESMNFASLRHLPVIFVCENNYYSVYSPIEVRQPPCTSYCQMAASNGIKTALVSDNDVETISKATSEAIDSIRNGKGPFFLEIETYRFREHCGPNYDDDLGYRPQSEISDWCEKDSITRIKDEIPEDLIVKWKSEINSEIDKAFQFAESGGFLNSDELENKVYSNG